MKINLSFVLALLFLGTAFASHAATPAFTMDQTVSDQAQRTTIAFSGLAMMTGNLESQSFFPPGKVADYTGFQYLRDNDPSGMGHNTSFLTRVANNVIYSLSDAQFAQLKTLATSQLEQINLYGYQRFALMKAFRELLDGTVPANSAGLDLTAVKAASKALYLIDGQISFDRAMLYTSILGSLTDAQNAYLSAMKGKGFSAWPDISNEQIRAKMQGLPQGTAVAVMTYASDLFSWFAGSVAADVYFCPERHGTYFGSFYIKDAPAIGHEGYSINEQLTATAGAALCDSSKGYVTAAQASLMSSLVELQRSNLYTGTTNIVGLRTQIATLLRSLLVSTASSASVNAQVLALSGSYGELDGENNYHYATVFAQIYGTLSSAQKTALAALRKSIMSGTYADGTAFDFSVCTTPFLYSSAIADLTALTPYLSKADGLFATTSQTVTAPVITQQPASVTVKLADTLSLSVVANGATGYQWRKDGKTLTGATAGTLVLGNATLVTAGSYDVILSNTGTATTTSTTAVVQVLNSKIKPPLPMITAQPTAANSGQLGISESVPLTVKASTAPGTVLSYQWRKGGQALTGATAVILTLNNLTTASAGRYDVVVSSAAGSVISMPVTISVGLAPTKLPELSTLRLEGTGTDSLAGSFALAKEWDLVGATLDDGDATTRETYTYQRVSSTKSNVRYTGTTTRAGVTETRQGTYVLTFTDYATTAQTYTGTCVFSGTRSSKLNGKTITGKLSATGVFYLVK